MTLESHLHPADRPAIFPTAMADFSKNLFTYFRTSDPALENRDFIVSSASGRFTYGDLDRRSAQIAQSLVASGVKPGDRVAVQTQKCVEFIFLYCACLRVGAVFLPLNPAYTAHEVSYFLRDSQAHTFVAAPERLNELERIARESGVKVVWTLSAKAGSLLRDANERDSSFATVDRSENDLAAILYTSGTTGRSKGAMLSHQNLISNALTLIHEWGFADSDVLIHSLPLFHTHGLFVACHCVLFSGSSMIFNEKFDPSSAIAQFEKGTVLMGVPTFYTRLLEEVSLRSDRLGQMRLFISGSAPLLSETHVAFEQRTKMKILERYGMTETTMLTSN
ncbi:MAG TPA: AMP-binding protein, partial [Bdellovibrionales bacterium]|nr:AMP-binding protein [Bdellovibrionales bacterium]